MKHTKRIIALLIVFSTILCNLYGCSKGKTDESLYLTKGEFFAYFVYENNMSSDKYSADEILRCQDGSVEAEIIVEWGYLPAEYALKNLSSKVTKEIVTMVCANATFDLLEGDTSKIKDADMLRDPQLIANAYASGLVDLENGYFDGEEKMTFADCERIIDRSRDYTANFHFAPNTEICEVADDAVVYDGEDYQDGDFVVQFFGENEEPVDVDPSKTGMLMLDGSMVSMSAKSDRYSSEEIMAIRHGKTQTRTHLLNSANPIGANGIFGFSVIVPQKVFEKDLHNPKIGDTVIISKYQVLFNHNLGFGSSEIIGILKEIKKVGANYDCTFLKPSFEQSVEKKNVSQSNVSGVKPSNFTKELGEYMGWKLDFDLNGNSIKVKASKDFTVYETGRKQNWQNSKKTIKATASLELSNFNVDVENLKSFASKRGEGYVKITCDSKMAFSLSTSLRYTPDDNRNGKFPSNWNNSRWTDSDSKGAKEIKIARFTPTNGVVGANVYIYLKISVDGKITFETSLEDGGVQIASRNGHVSCTKLGKKSTKASANIDVNGRIGVDAKLVIFGFINVIEYDIGIDLDATAVVDLYYEEELKSSGVHADEEGLNEYAAADGKFNYCIDLSAVFKVSGKLKDSAVKIVLDALSHGNSLDFSLQIWTWGVHFEDGAFVDECTRGKDTDEDSIDASSDDEIELSTYKVILDNYTCATVSLGAIPAESQDFYNSSNAITVWSKDEDIAKVSFDKKNKLIIVEAVGEGSTQIIIKAKKGILWWKKTVEQSIAVTVNSVYDYVSDGEVA